MLLLPVLCHSWFSTSVHSILRVDFGHGPDFDDLPPTGILHLLRVALHFCTVVLCNGLLHSVAAQQASLKVLWACFLDFTLGSLTSEVVLGILVGLHSDFRDLGLLVLVDFS